MDDDIKALRNALEAAPTPGEWRAFNHSWSDTSILAPNFDHAICCLDINHATEESQDTDEAQMAANASLIAAANPARIARLLDRLEAAEADAGRYRWLRDDLNSDWAICEWSHDEPDGIGYYRDARAADVVDAAIDQARAAMQAKKPPA